jgi:hypothetical protein
MCAGIRAVASEDPDQRHAAEHEQHAGDPARADVPLREADEAELNTIVPIRKLANAARKGLFSQCASCALAPAWNGISAPATNPKSS